MNRLLDHLRSNLVAYLALFIALGGTSYAAFTLPANSVGTRQLRNNSITPIKFKTSEIAANIRAWAVIQGGTQVVASRPRAKVLDWDPSFGAGDISWGPGISQSCIPLATGGRDFIQTGLLPRGHSVVAHYQAYSSNGQYDANPVDTFIAVLCPEP